MMLASEPIVTSSPIATPSWMRTWSRMSQERPTIAPSISALRPTCVEASITVRVVRARSRSVTPFESTEYGPTEASARDPAVVADERGPLDLLDVVDVGALADPDVAAQPDARRCSAARCSSSASKFACRYWSRLPMSCQ